ncbi:uncharacterized protein LOC144134226 [Amblyomma americanum]
MTIGYLYAGVFNPGSFEAAVFTREAAKRYEVKDLISACSKYIEAHLIPDKVCPLLDCLNTRDLGVADNAAIAILRNRCAAVLQSATFLDSSDTTVHFVLDVVASVPESLVADSLRRWVEQKREKDLYTDAIPFQLNVIMRPFLPQLRLLALTEDEYIKGPGL